MFNICTARTWASFQISFPNLYQFSPTTILPNRHLTSLLSLLCLPSLYVQDLPPHLDYKPSLTAPLQEPQHWAEGDPQ